MTNTGMIDDKIKTQNPHDGRSPGLDLGELSASQELMFSSPPNPVMVRQWPELGSAQMWVRGHGCMDTDAWMWVHGH